MTDSSSEAGEGSDFNLMAPLPLSWVYAAPPLVGHAELAYWRSRYLLPSPIVLRVPTPEERPSSYIPGEIAVYEAFFDSGLRGTIPALIAGFCNLFEISPSQLNPPAWRILIAIQNLGDLEYLFLLISCPLVVGALSSGTIGIMSNRSSSSVPTTADRARSKRRIESPVSRLDSSSEAGEGSDCDLMVPLPLSCVYAAPPLVGLASSVSEDELADWRSRYLLPSSIVLQVPTPEERASSYIPGEIAVYEAFFDLGLRGTIPALIAGLCNLFEISPSQLNPSAWRILIAIQNLGDLEYLSLGINEVMFAYHLAPLNKEEGRFHLRPHSGFPIVEELPKNDRKGPVFNKKWQERYARSPDPLIDGIL
ncbi:hypothetical protein HID58_048438 [Brassica napus]|uniref:Uncharacterized protein n=1 Tax=Brassica napus TaxID=3708 RepID=A0ABQ8B3P2_BRANA|nr:hypothetical protein HID58_048438 [Brassica napus]